MPFHRSRTKHPSFRPGLELLEDRTVPAIIINGTPGNDVISTAVTPIDGSEQLLGEIFVNGALEYSFIGNRFNHPTLSVHLPDQLFVYGLEGNDSINLGNLRDPESQQYRTHLYGGPGDDTLVGSAGHDNIFGEEGADSLDGYGDEDTLFGDTDDVKFAGGGGVDILQIDVFAGILQANSTSLTLNGRTLSGSNYSNIHGITVTGSEGNDVFDIDALLPPEFGISFVVIHAGGGNDQIRLNVTDIEVHAGSGNDTITSLASYTSDLFIFGDEGHDAIVVYSNGTIDGGSGNDRIDARRVVNNHTGVNIMGGPGNDTLTGSRNSDWLDGGEDKDTITGLAGDDVLIGGQGIDSLTGNDGDDYIEGDANDVSWVGGPGFNQVYVIDAIQNGLITRKQAKLDGNTILATDLAIYHITGTEFNDTLDAIAYTGDVFMYGMAGDDFLRSGAGVAVLVGGPGHDTLISAAGDDYLDGEDGDDVLSSGAGNDTVLGGLGSDQLDAGSGDDNLGADLDDTLLFAGEGNDFLGFTSEASTATITDSYFVINGLTFNNHGAENLYLGGTSGDDVLDASAYTGSAALSGYDGNDTLVGGSGHDYLQGGEGDDTLIGNDGDDTLLGEAGVDTLLGGQGADTFYRELDEAAFLLEQLLWDYDELEGDILI